jgi:predicted dehydrogenase
LTLNVALLGYGYAGKTFHAPLIVATPGLRLAVVASSDPAKVRADLPGVAVLLDADAVLAQGRLDLVVIATPNDTHADLARRALQAGRHVVVDKPFTLTLAEAQGLADLAASAGRVLAVFHNRRWDADFLTLSRLVADGTLGEVLALESRFDRFRPQVRRRWREAAIPGGGLWYDLGPHLVDQALRLFGLPEAVYADLAPQRPGAEAVDYCHVLLRYPRRRVVLHASMLVAADSPRFAAHGTSGSYLKHGLDPQEDALKRGERPGGPGWGWGRDPRPGLLTTAGPDGTMTTVPVPGEPGDYPAFYAGVRDAILGRGPNPVPPEEAVEVMAVLELALASAAEGRELAFDSDVRVGAG